MAGLKLDHRKGWKPRKLSTWTMRWSIWTVIQAGPRSKMTMKLLIWMKSSTWTRTWQTWMPSNQRQITSSSRKSTNRSRPPRPKTLQLFVYANMISPSRMTIIIAHLGYGCKATLKTGTFLPKMRCSRTLWRTTPRKQ